MRLLLALALAAASPAFAGARQEAKVIYSENPGLRKAQEEWGFADAVVTDDTVYLSGVVVDLRPGETLEAAYTRTFGIIGNILRRAGVGWDDVVEITSFHTDLTSQLPAMVAVKQRHIQPPAPAWTAVGVSRLVPDRGITEVKIVAKLPTKR